MDANTQKKTLSGVLVALLVGSVFVGFFTAAVTPIASAMTTSSHTVIVDNASATYTIAGITPALTPSSEPIVFNTSYAGIKFGHMPSTDSGNLYKLCRPTATDGTCDLVGNNRTGLASDIAGQLNVTFPSQSFDAVGPWSVVNVNTSDTLLFFEVNASNELTVSLSRSSAPVSTSDADNITFTVTVTNSSGPVPNTDLTDTCGIIPPGTTTDSNGQYAFIGIIPAVESCFINASRELGGIATLPEQTGSAIFTITARTLTVAGVDTTVRAGFAETAEWNLTYPNGTSVFKTNDAQTAIAFPPAWYNLSVRGPGSDTNGVREFVNTSGSEPTCSEGATVLDPWDDGAVGNWSKSAGAASCSSGGATSAWNYTDFGNFSFIPSNGTWLAGTYTFRLDVNTAGDDRPEYTVTWTLSTQTPASVNLKLTNSTSGKEMKNLTVLPVRGDPTGPLDYGFYDLNLQILGAAQTEFPGTGGSFGPFDATNITVTGDVLPITSGSPFITEVGSGVWLVSHLVPTRGAGSVTINVDWKGLNTTLTIPIVQGATNSVDKSEITVDTTSTLTVTISSVTSAGTDPEPLAKVYLFKYDPTDGDISPYPGAEGVAINGTAGTGTGHNGQYVFSVRPTEVGDLALFAITGSQEGTCTLPYPDDVQESTCRENRNFTYGIVKVVPAHDLGLTLTNTTLMAAQTTPIFVNSTLMSQGIFAFTTPAAGRIYFLDDAQWRDLNTNGSKSTGMTSLFASYPQNDFAGLGAVVSVDTADATGANLNVTLDAGNWHAYVCTNFTSAGPGSGTGCVDAKHDNRDTAPIINVTAFHAVFTPPAITADPDIESDTPVNVTITDQWGNPWNGTLAVSGDSFITSNATINVVDGMGSFTATGFGVTGNETFTFDPDGGIAAASAVDTFFEVSAPNVVVSPSKIPVGQTTTVIITVKALNGTPLVDRGIQLCGSPIGGPTTPVDNSSGCTGSVFTNDQGFVTQGVLPTSTGTLYLFVNGTKTATTVPVFAGLQITADPASPTANMSVTLTVKQVGATQGEPGVTVIVMQNGTAVSGFPQTTTTSGQVVLPNVQAGTYDITAVKTGFDNGTLTLVVGAQQVNNNTANFALSNLNAPTSGQVGTPMDVSADLANTGGADGTATVSLLVNGLNVDSRTITVAAGGTEHLGFTFTPNHAGTFNVTVKLSTGQTLAEQHITVTTPTTETSTTTTSTSTSTSTSTTTSTTSTSSTTSTTTSTPAPTKVPGFEIVALIGALGVALLVLRRRS